MPTVGEKLRKARLDKNISLEEVYKQTKIHPHVLEGLEQDRAHNFLSPLYIKGFLKTYARYLGLDGEKTVKEYSDSRKAEFSRPQAQAVEALTNLPKKPGFSLKVKPILVIRVVLILFVSFLLFKSFHFIFRRIAHRPVSEQAAEPRIKVDVLPAVFTASEDLSAAFDGEELALEVRTKDNCWMRVKADDEVIFEKTLSKGKSERWQAKEKLELRIGKPEALDVFFNGQALDLKKLKVRKSLIITHQGIEQH